MRYLVASLFGLVMLVQCIKKQLQLFLFLFFFFKRTLHIYSHCIPERENPLQLCKVWKQFLEKQDFP